ncbi:plant intracellular Ras-group-related LRR protein 6-like [Mangifera indica]|uniref:plant intracellular Ras-group-related LRR protein 6-like n=1 Tax=Mangifera indica TaxID=29780 RepID=UPI001CFB7B78|nr:plant intracellular Ras-group-related LRR protein 6-like [Mangifera indica]
MMYEQQHLQMRLDARKTAAESRRSIEEERLEVIDLSGKSLDSLPNPCLNLASICKLDLSNNNLQNISESLITRLVNVLVFDVHSNQLKSLPTSIGCLSKLKVLNVSGNLLESLPKSIENCRSLEELSVNFNKLKVLPENIGFALLNLKKLSINSNKLVFLPQSTTHLTSLRILDARLNCLTSLPEDIDNLFNLQVLNVSQNFQYLDNLPYSVGFLQSLVELDVSYNKITILPDSIGCLKKLQKLRVEGNPLVSPPMEVVIWQSIHAVKEYLSEKMNAEHKTQTKKKSWVGKLVKYRTFNAQIRSNNISNSEENEGFIMPEYRSIDGLASPGYMGMFSPRRLFSSRTYFTS